MNDRVRNRAVSVGHAVLLIVSDTLAKHPGQGQPAVLEAGARLSGEAATGAAHLHPFAVETMSESARRLLRELHHSVGTGSVFGAEAA